MRNKSAIGILLAGTVLGCTAQPPGGPADRTPPGGEAALTGPATGKGLAPSDLRGRTVGAPGLSAPGGPGTAGGGIPQVLQPEAAPAADPPLPPEALQYRAPVYSVADVLKQSDLGPLPEEAAPPTDLIKRILPSKLSQAQARQLLLQVPRDMVRLEALDDAGSGRIGASSAGGSYYLDDDRWSREGGSRGSASAGARGGAWSGGGERGSGGGDRWSKGGDRGSNGGDRWSKGGDRGSNAGDRWSKGGDRWSEGDKRKGKRNSRWSRFGHDDRDLFVASSFGWADFAFGGAFFFFPATIFSALHFFPYTYAAGYFYPAFCPFYFSAAFFTPYCQAPVVFFGTFGLVSGCPTCPISGRPLLWLPGEVPVL
ncbi:MAG: hypothetical protein FJZ01_23085 [Candidatus Sericytochromatia bacterium]|nr:hypothetical protein [Candidatus Tanganyikabacteria bacterium]